MKEKFPVVMSHTDGGKERGGFGEVVDTKNEEMEEAATPAGATFLAGVDVARPKGAESQAGGRALEDGQGRREPNRFVDPSVPIDARGINPSVDELSLKKRYRGTLDEQVPSVPKIGEPKDRVVIQPSREILAQRATAPGGVFGSVEITSERLGRLAKAIEEKARIVEDLKQRVNPERGLYEEVASLGTQASDQNREALVEKVRKFAERPKEEHPSLSHALERARRELQEMREEYEIVRSIFERSSRHSKQ